MKKTIILFLFIAISIFIWTVGCRQQHPVKMDPIDWGSTTISDTTYAAATAIKADTASVDTLKK